MKEPIRCGHCGEWIPTEGRCDRLYCSRRCMKKAVQLRYHHRRLAGTPEERERGKRVAREYRKRMKEAGRCTRCGSDDVAEGYTMCRSCNARGL